MPHDINGKEVFVGQRVVIEAIVESVQAGPDYCNTTLRTTRPMPSYPTGTQIVLNTKQVEIVAEAPEPSPE